MDNYSKSLAEAVARQTLADAYCSYIESPLIKNAPQPNRSKEEKKSENFSVRIPSWVRSGLEKIAEQEDITISQLINNAVTNALVKHQDTAEARKIYLDETEKQRLALNEHLPPDKGISAIFKAQRELNNDKE